MLRLSSLFASLRLRSKKESSVALKKPTNKKSLSFSRLTRVYQSLKSSGRPEPKLVLLLWAMGLFMDEKTHQLILEAVVALRLQRLQDQKPWQHEG
jgi:hypothetical protein